jgi:hypothetical protein
VKVLLFGFDGLRRDCITPAVMPRLSGFLADNVHCTRHRAVYPTETYVNHPSIFSGFLPEIHGIVANAFFDASVSRTDFFLGSVVERIEAVERQTHGKLYRVPSVTETVARAGRPVVSISSNSAGSTRLIAHKSGSVGGVNIAVNGVQHALPVDLRRALFGDQVSGEFSIPDLAGLRRMNEIYRTVSERNGIPDLGIVWYGEPDHSFHRYGITGTESIESLRVADECFGELYDEYAAGNEEIQVAVVSDHGHITVREHFDITDALVRCGFRAGKDIADPDADFVLLWGYSGNIYVLKPELTRSICDALMDMPQIGMLFTRDLDGVRGVVPGTFSRRLVGGDDESRAGDIRFILKHESDETCVCAAPIPVGGGIHGGLARGELNCLLGWGGSAFRDATRVDAVTGAIDVTPTIYHLLGITPSVLPQGRVISEALAEPFRDDAVANHRTYETGAPGFSQAIELDTINGHAYLEWGGRV